MSDENTIVADRQLLADAQKQGTLATLRAYLKLSGPGWLQSAITLGGGSLAGSLYLGVLAGFGLLWLQPLAMILGIIMLSAIAYVTTSTGERPFPAINKHVNPVLGWSWALASLAANMVWCLPQFSLANGVVQQNLLPNQLGPNSALGDFNGKLVISIAILIVTVAITWSYDRGGWGIKLYELVLKIMVGMIVLCFGGVVVKLAMSSGGLDWGAIFGGFIPDFTQLTRPAPVFEPMLEQLSAPALAYWQDKIVNIQQDIIVSAAATAVGINMTFLFPYSMLRKGWTKEFRGLAVFDLSTGMLIPFMLATSCVVVASASQFHGKPLPGLLGELDAAGQPIKPRGKAVGEYCGLLKARVQANNSQLTAADFDPETQGADKVNALIQSEAQKLPEVERRLAACLVNRDAQDLAYSLNALFSDSEGKGGKFFADIVFGLGVLGMTLSTITLLMLISGFVICEIFNLPPTGWPHRLGCLAAATGVLGPFFWSKAAFALAIPTSVFGYMLIPVAYLTFFLLMNQRTLLGSDMPQGGQRLLWNLLMGVACLLTTAASVYVVFGKAGYYGLGAWAALIGAAAVVHFVRPPQ